ncbi:MAG: hypothetical protein KC729_05010 [Candidatus Eisenbacteria bacterium]|uniref:Uncharacterized protein n=1 Tax=Eiseniibacteriota bacterium TaxID=2212470 RepID=A0A956LY03_UNCEI|nr:hypothetical protein [Candidatus Eisenbacteria bacterium]
MNRIALLGATTILALFSPVLVSGQTRITVTGTIFPAYDERCGGILLGFDPDWMTRIALPPPISEDLIGAWVSVSGILGPSQTCGEAPYQMTDVRIRDAEPIDFGLGRLRLNEDCRLWDSFDHGTVQLWGSPVPDSARTVDVYRIVGTVDYRVWGFCSGYLVPIHPTELILAVNPIERASWGDIKVRYREMR